MKVSVERDRLTTELAELASISAEPAPVVTRVVYTAADMAARQFVKRLCMEAGLVLREDAAGNTFARWPGTDKALAPVGTGSHIDAIPNAGAYDGTVGVLGGLEAIRSLSRAGFQPRRSLELVLFTSEEPTRFGIGCLGSRLMAGTLAASCGESLRDRDGQTLNQARQAAGFTGRLEDARLPQDYYSAFVELHIEQGPLLEQHGNDIGVVTAIAAPASLRITIEGEGGHAGAVLMPQRRDAFAAACEVVLAVEQAALSTGSADTVGTTGVCHVFPGAINSIPSKVTLDIDVRDVDLARRDAVLHEIERSTTAVCQRRKLTYSLDWLNTDPPARCDPRIVEVLTQACEQLGLRSERMISRAYHDSLFMARIAPVAMLFVPSRGGVSHRPDEYSPPDQIAQGVLVLATSLATLSA